MSEANASAAIVIRAHRGRPFYEAKFRHRGTQVKRRIGPAWLDHDRERGGWQRRRGRVPEGFYDERRAHVAAAQLVKSYVAGIGVRPTWRPSLRAAALGFAVLAGGAMLLGDAGRLPAARRPVAARPAVHAPHPHARTISAQRATQTFDEAVSIR